MPAGVTPVQVFNGTQPGVKPVQLVDQFGSAITSTVYPASTFGAQGNGINDDSSAINLALTTAANAGGGIVLLGPGTYSIGSGIVIPGDKVILRGSGFDTIIKPVSGANFDAISTPIPGVVGTTGFIRNYIGIEMLMVDCSLMTGSTAGAGNGIHFYGVRYGFIRKVFITTSPNWAILLDGDNSAPGQNFGFDNLIQDCIFDLCAGNCFQNNCEANDYINCRFKWAAAATAAAQPAFGSQDTNTYHLRLNSGYSYVAGNVFGKGGTYTNPAILCSNSGPCRILGNRFDQVRAQAVTLNAGNHEFCFNALGSPCSANLGNPAIQLGNSNNRVVGNSFDNTAGSTHHTFCVSEAGGPFTNNIIADNNFIQGTSGNGFVSLNATSTAHVHHNGGYNPVGSVTAPTFPGTTIAVQNTTGLDVTAFVVNGTGTITQVAITGSVASTNTNFQIAASGFAAIRIPAGASIAFTYAAGAPAWTWFAD